MKRKIRVPFLIVNPKAYIYGQESLELAKVCDQLAEEYDLDIIFTAQHVDLRMVSEATTNIIVTAQHMDGIVPGRGMGHTSGRHQRCGRTSCCIESRRISYAGST